MVQSATSTSKTGATIVRYKLIAPLHNIGEILAMVQSTSKTGATIVRYKLIAPLHDIGEFRRRPTPIFHGTNRYRPKSFPSYR